MEKAIGEVSKTNKVQATDFTKKFQAIVEKYNERKEEDVLVSSVLEDFSNDIIDLYHDLKTEMTSFEDMGIDFQEKAFYDILKSLSVKYDFTYPDDKMIELAKKAKAVVDSVASFPAWNQREDIKAELQVKLILLLAEYGYPPEAENFKKHNVKARN